MSGEKLCWGYELSKSAQNVSIFLRESYVRHEASLMDKAPHSVDPVNLLSQQCPWVCETKIHHGVNEDYLWLQNHSALINGHLATALMNVIFSVISDGSRAPENHYTSRNRKTTWC